MIYIFILLLIKFSKAYNAMKHKRNEERDQGGPWPPNKEQNWENKEQNVGKKLQNWAFLGCGNS